MSTATALDVDRLFIDGRWAAPRSGARIEVVSPSTEERVGSAPEASEADVDAAVAAARRAFDDPGGWSSWPAADRASALERFADAHEARGAEVARRVSLQNGMPISAALQSEAVLPAAHARYCAGLVRGSATEDDRAGALGGSVHVARDPIGVVATLVPWNFPQALAVAMAAPALAAGCTVVVKPSPETVLDAPLLAEAVLEAGIPAGVVNIVPGGRETGEHLVAHPGVDLVTFTGSTSAGRVIGEVCGRLLRPVLLELGGKSAALVLEDADLTANAEQFFAATLLNNGQTCYLGTRILAPRSCYEEVVEVVGALTADLRVGDALDPATEVGPLVSQRQREQVEGHLATARADGARVVTGGGRPRGRGFFVEPTVLADVTPDQAISREEVFGPVLTITPFDDEDHAVRLANDSAYGLAGTVWTADAARGQALARRIRTGSVGINHYLPDPAAPYGGVKDSGIGRWGGPEGLATYQRLQSIYHPPQG